MFLVEELGIGPVVLVGQSLGGQTALLVAADRPDLVRGLVLADAGPVQDAEGSVAQVEADLATWPVPFASRAAAERFFAGPRLRAELWAAGLEERVDGWWPRFELEVMSRTLREASGRSYWDEWETIQCPTLVVRATNGGLSDSDAAEMRSRLPGTRVLELRDTGHDLHLESPEEWGRTLASFLDTLGP